MADKIIRVAQIIGIAGTGGVESVIMNYYRHIDKTKIQFDFFVESDSIIIDKKFIESMGGKVVIIPPYKKIFKFIKELVRLLKEGNYDIVHSNMNALSVFSLFAASLAGNKIRIAHSHTTTNKKEWKKNIIKLILRPFSKVFATHYFACSEVAGRWLFGDRTFKKGKVTIINNAIDTDKFAFDFNKREKIRKELNIKDEILIGHIGRFVPQKNHDFIINIFNDYYKQNHNSKLLLIGEGEDMTKIQNLVKEKCLLNQVIFLGGVNNTYDYYQAMDCFILPSLYEGLPVVGVEAQACLLPCYFSNNVTSEILINTNVKILNLNVKEWVSELVKINIFERNSCINNVLNSKYNIVKESEKLKDIYISIVKNEKKRGRKWSQ